MYTTLYTNLISPARSRPHIRLERRSLGRPFHSLDSTIGTFPAVVSRSGCVHRSLSERLKCHRFASLGLSIQAPPASLAAGARSDRVRGNAHSPYKLRCHPVRAAQSLSRLQPTDRTPHRVRSSASSQSQGPPSGSSPFRRTPYHHNAASAAADSPRS